MKKLTPIVLIPALLLFATAVVAGGDARQNEYEEQLQAERRAMLEEAEQARQEAEKAREGARNAAEMAREAARLNAEMSREEARMEAEKAWEASRVDAQMSREEAEQAWRTSEQLAGERALQNEEIARTREELSKTHRELREATREVARAHRDLARADHSHQVSRHVNLGDRAVIGVVLGNETEKGVKIIGVSPDGPAERAGLEQGDILVSIEDVELAGNDKARDSVFSVMNDVSDGEELEVTIERDGESLVYTVTAEHREPRGWQSVIRIPEIEVITVEPGEPAEPAQPHVIIERIEVPELDEVALAVQVEEIAEHLERFEFEFDEYSDFGRNAMHEARVWYGLPRAHGLELTTINEGLGAYFKTDRGVLVIKAKGDNAYQLESGDVVLSIGKTSVNSPSDMLRALRDIEPGSEIDIEIKRKQRDRTLSVVVPEDRLGHR